MRSLWMCCALLLGCHDWDGLASQAMPVQADGVRDGGDDDRRGDAAIDAGSDASASIGHAGRDAHVGVGQAGEGESRAIDVDGGADAAATADAATAVSADGSVAADGGDEALGTAREPELPSDGGAPACVDDEVDDACACSGVGRTQPCCADRGTQTCVATSDSSRAWSECSVAAADETCNGIDDDCDGTSDEHGAELCTAVAGQSCVAGGCRCPEGQLECGGACMAVGAACDGDDADRCAEGVLACASGTVVCNDATGNNAESCNGRDDDCDARTDEAASTACNAAVTGQSCNAAGACVCPGGQVPCGGRCQTTGTACDGGDADACKEGTLVCSGGAIVCSDATGDSGTAQPQCGNDLDCDGALHENVACTPAQSQGCRVCSAAGNDTFNAGSQSCASSCGWQGCVGGGAAANGIAAGPAASPWTLSSACGGTTASSAGYTIPYRDISTNCQVATSATYVLRPGRYDVVVDNHDSAVLVTPQFSFRVASTGFQYTVSNAIAGWQTHTFSFSIGSCSTTTFSLVQLATFYDGSAGGSAGWYRGGNTIGTVRISGPY